MPAAAYELLPSSSVRQPFEASGSAWIATPTNHGRSSDFRDRVHVLAALGRKSPWLALLALFGLLALLHEMLAIGSFAAQRLSQPGDKPIPKHSVSREETAWEDLVGNYSYGVCLSPPVGEDGADLKLPPGELARTVPGAHFRDLHPVRSVTRFLALAESEIATLGLSTCDGKLGSELAQ